MLTLQGAIVAMTAEAHLLAVVYHAGLCQGRDQNLAAFVWDMAEQTRHGPLATQCVATSVKAAGLHAGARAVDHALGMCSLSSIPRC